jgi:biopolymer transport protein ExbB
MNKVQTQRKESAFSKMFATLAIPVLFIVAVLIYMFVLGNPNNFEGGDPNGHPVEEGVAHVLGLVYKGGYVVPLLITLVLICITFSIERFLAIGKASGKKSNDTFLSTVKVHLSSNNIEAALKECDKQQGSVANVVRSTLIKYQEMEKAVDLDKDQKVLAIQKELEESVQLELPMLERNLVIIATLASVSTLVALLGTVLGMIKAFSALASAGSPDSVALANGISEALINTALGIGNSALATIMYNVFTTKIDKITYTIDEAGFTITQQFAASHKK